jgi:hypothetical protein
MPKSIPKRKIGDRVKFGDIKAERAYGLHGDALRLGLFSIISKT